MDPFPHHYTVTAEADRQSHVRLGCQGLEPLMSAPPAEFGGPGDCWSPETLLVAALSDCFILSFRAVAEASRFEWESVRCDTEGVLERIDRETRFTHFTNRVTLKVGPDVSRSRAERLLEKAESVCLVSNSLKAEVHLEAVVEGSETP